MRRKDSREVHKCSQQFAGCLDRPFRPAKLLGPQPFHGRGKFRRHLDIPHKFDAPPGKLRPIAQVEILRNGIGLPPAGIHNGSAAPHARRTIEMQKAVCAAACELLYREMGIQAHGLNARK